LILVYSLIHSTEGISVFDSITWISHKINKYNITKPCNIIFNGQNSELKALNKYSGL